ncbi:MAG: hypothetical protein LBI95_01835 [Holosporales bacterium]|nr:hypothetical protein [Holosporales bacterium]
MVYCLFRLSCRIHVMFESGRVFLKVLNQLFHVEHFIFEVGRLIQALTGKDEKIAVLAYFKALGHGLLPIQVGPCRSHSY